MNNTREIKEKFPTGFAMILVWAEYCNACSMTKPEFEKVTTEHSIPSVMVQIEDAQDLVRELKLGGTPSIIYIKDGEAVAQTLGYLPAVEIEKEVQKWNQ